MASTLTLLDLLDVAAALGNKVVNVQHGCVLRVCDQPFFALRWWRGSRTSLRFDSCAAVARVSLLVLPTHAASLWNPTIFSRTDSCITLDTTLRHKTTTCIFSANTSRSDSYKITSIGTRCYKPALFIPPSALALQPSDTAHLLSSISRTVYWSLKLDCLFTQDHQPRPSLYARGQHVHTS